jgi:hypothetical protein
MPHPSSSRQHARIVAHRMRHRQPRHERASQRERAHIVAQLIAASQALVADPDAAALLLDGALAQLLDLWARQAHLPSLDRRLALDALEARAPTAAWRVRLALQAQQPEARLAHCWALLDLLTTTTTTIHPRSAAPRARANPTRYYVNPMRFRTNGASHVS